MGERVTHLPVVVPARGEAPEDIGTGSRLREVTELVAADPSSWTPERAAQVGTLFEEVSGSWHLHHDPDRLAPLVDALDRGGPFAGPVVELGAGAGAGTRELASRFGRVVALDLAVGMLARLEVAGAARVRADASALPMADRSVGALVCVNMLLFSDEARRVLGPDGALVWVNTIGACTPIHLSAEAVAASLGPGFVVSTSTASWGTWAVARRS